SARGLSAQIAPAERWWLAACLCRSWTTSLKPALCTLAAMRPPMVPSPTNPTTTLSLDIASPPLRFSDFDRHQVSLCGPHCGRPACTKGEMRDDLDGHGGHFPNSTRSTFSAWLRCRRATLSPACSTSWRHVSPERDALVGPVP